MRLRTVFGRACASLMVFLWAFSIGADLWGQSTEEWIGQLGDADSENRVAAARALGAFGGTLENKKVIPALSQNVYSSVALWARKQNSSTIARTRHRRSPCNVWPNKEHVVGVLSKTSKRVKESADSTNMKHAAG